MNENVCINNFYSIILALCVKEMFQECKLNIKQYKQTNSNMMIKISLKVQHFISISTEKNIKV